MELQTDRNMTVSLPEIEGTSPEISSIITGYKKQIRNDVSILEEQKVYSTFFSRGKKNNIEPSFKRGIHHLGTKKKSNKLVHKQKEQQQTHSILKAHSSFKNKKSIKLPTLKISKNKNEFYYITSSQQGQQHLKHSLINERNCFLTDESAILREKFLQTQNHLNRKLNQIHLDVKDSFQTLANQSQNISKFNSYMIEKCNNTLTKFDEKINIVSDEFIKVPVEKKKYCINTALDKMIDKIRTVNPITAQILLTKLSKRKNKNLLRKNNQEKNHEVVMSLLENERITANKIMLISDKK